MSIQNDRMQYLLKKQEEERGDLMDAAYVQWLKVKQYERDILADFNGSYEKAFPEIKEQINENRHAFFEEWGAEGRLTALMAERQEKDRKKLIEKLSIEEQLRRKSENKNDRDKDHDR